MHVPPGGSATSGSHYNHTVASSSDWEMVLLSTADGIDDDMKYHAKNVITSKSAQLSVRLVDFLQTRWSISS